MDGIMDPNWLGTVIEISITLFIFLLGVPALVFQTFVPGNLRKIYNERIGKKYINSLFVYAFMILLFLIFPANHGVYYILKNLFPSNYEVLVNIWYIVILILLIFFFIYAFWKFYEQLKHFSGGSGEGFNPRKDILREIINSCQKKYSSSEDARISKGDYDDLVFLGKYFEKGKRTEIYIREFKKLIAFILNCPNHPYVGNNIKGAKLLEPLKICITNSLDSADHGNIYDLLELFSWFESEIFNKLRLEKSRTIPIEDPLQFGDLNELIHISFEIGLIALSKKDNKNISKAISIFLKIKMKILSFQKDKSPPFESTYSENLGNVRNAATINFYYLSKNIILERRFKLLPRIFDELRQNNFDKTEFPYLIALLALFFSINKLAALEAKKRFNRFSAKKTMLKKAERHFINLGEYDVAQIIQNFSLSIFPPEIINGNRIKFYF